MKKFLINLLLIITLFSTMCVLATEEVLEESQIISIDNYEDYEALFDPEEQLSDEEKEEQYQEQMADWEKYYDESETENLIRARVILAGEAEISYESDYYGGIIKMKEQNVEVEILEGEYAGRHAHVKYPLMADSLLNLEVLELKKGDEIYVVGIKLDEKTDTLYAEIGNIGFNLERKAGMIILAVVAIILVCAFCKERGILSILISILIVSITLLIYSEQIYLGTMIMLLALCLSVLLISMIVIQKLGLTEDAFLVGFSSLLVIMVITLITFGVDYMLKNTGDTFEVALMLEFIIKRNIDFHHMFIGSIILILSVILPYVACNVWEKCKESSESSFNKLLDISKDAITGKIEMVTMILMVSLMPKLIYLYAYKYQLSDGLLYNYSTNEIINSDILVAEFIRLFMCIIAIALTVPMTVAIYKLKDNV